MVKTILAAGWLGALKSATVIRNVDERIMLYNAERKGKLREFCIAGLSSRQLYSLAAELAIAWSLSHRALGFLLKRHEGWQKYVNSVWYVYRDGGYNCLV